MTIAGAMQTPAQQQPRPALYTIAGHSNRPITRSHGRIASPAFAALAITAKVASPDHPTTTTTHAPCFLS
jgi:hypothetical protein